MPSQAMPAKLVVIFILWSLSLSLDLYNLTGEDSGVGNYIRIALNVGLLLGLLRGKEWARVLAKVTGLINVVSGGLLLVMLLSLGSAAFLIPALGVLAYVTVALAIGYGGYLLWCMNQQDVQDWLMRRSLNE